MTTWEEASLSKMIDPKDLRAKVKALKKSGKTIATINGSFDLLHAGHLYMLFEASRQADLLIVGLNTDRSIREYKSSKRPIISLSHRIEMMTALACVDYVTWFDETTPLELLKIIEPSVHVNGEEYGADCIEASVVQQGGGRLHLVKRIPGLATSAVIEKIQKQCV